MNTWCISVKREHEESAILHITCDEKPTQEQMEKLFSENGYMDDPDYCRFECWKV